MRESLLKAFHRLPPFARDLAASAHGARLRRWRYSRETESLAQAALERDGWEASQWRAWQAVRLSAVLEHAARTVPHYRSLGHGQAPALERWPILTKQVVREQPHALLSSDAAGKRLRVEHTSGTSGTPLRLWISRATARAWYALVEARWRRWYGVSLADRWAILGGQLVAPVAQRRPPFWVWNAAFRQLYLSSYHLSRETCSAYLAAMAERRVTYVWGYASSLYSLALFAAETGITPPPLRVIMSNAEPLYAHQRELIQRVFACPVHDSYGMTEAVCAASECEAGTLHLWPEAGMYEVLHDDRDEPVEAGQTGRLICTGFLNEDMPLIRYQVGDRVAIAPEHQRCACGRGLPILVGVDGRNDDVITTRDHRRIGRLDPVFKSDIPIREAQIVQESLDLVCILVVPGQGFTEAHEQALIAALRDRVGEMTVELRRVVAIPRSANGKFRAVISKVKPA